MRSRTFLISIAVGLVAACSTGAPPGPPPPQPPASVQPSASANPRAPEPEVVQPEVPLAPPAAMQPRAAPPPIESARNPAAGPAPAAQNAAAGSAAAAQTGAAGSAPELAGRGAAPEAAGPPPAGSPMTQWNELIAADWELAPGEEKYVCVRKTLREDFYMSKLHTVLGAGTHHTGLMVSDAPDRADGVNDCSLVEVGERLVGGAGPGTQDLELPPGIGIQFLTGNQVLFQLHLYNVSDVPLRGRTSASVAVIPKAEVQSEAQQVAAQLVVLTIPRGRTTARGRCTFDHAETLVAITPHMHQTGRHVKVTLHGNGKDTVLHDADYDFSEQRRYAISELPIAPGDTLDYECTYQNDSDRTIVWGESTNDEMCLIGTTVYPPGASNVCLL